MKTILKNFACWLLLFPLVCGFINIAHRGDNENDRYAQHSFLAYDRAVAQGADYLELDLQRTKDGVIVVSHDPNLSQVFGTYQVISNHTYASLCRYHNSAGEPLLSLQAVFNRYRSDSRLHFMLEPKTNPGQAGYEKQLVALIKKNKLSNRILFESFDPQVLKKLRKIDDHIPRTLLSQKASDCKKVGANQAFANGHLNSKAGRYLQKHHKQYLVWGANTIRQIKRLKHVGYVAGALSDYTGRVDQVKRIKAFVPQPVTGTVIVKNTHAVLYQLKNKKMQVLPSSLKPRQRLQINSVWRHQNQLWYELEQGKWIKQKDVALADWKGFSKPKITVVKTKLRIKRKAKLYASPNGTYYLHRTLPVNSKWLSPEKMVNKKGKLAYNLVGAQWVMAKNCQIIK